MGHRSHVSGWPSFLMSSFFCAVVPQPMSCVLLEHFSLLESGGRSALTIIFESLSHLSTFFSANHPRLLWDTCEHPLPPTGTSIPISPDLYTSSHPAKHASVYMRCGDIWCCLRGLSDLAASVCWETEIVNAGNLFVFFSPFTRINN